MGFYNNVYEVMFKNKPQAVLPRQARDVIFIIEKAFENGYYTHIAEMENMFFEHKSKDDGLRHETNKETCVFE